MARPHVKINWDEFDKLCAICCTQVEIASWFDCSVDTIERAVKREKATSFAEYYAQKASKGRISLRRQQWQMALRGDKTMLIWLGKQHLQQSEKVDQNLNARIEPHVIESPDGKERIVLDVREVEIK